MRAGAAMAAAVSVLALALGCACTAGASLGHAGRWITAPDGRVVIVHGVNMVYKRAPYYPGAAGFDEEDAGFIRSLGMNAVRVGVLWQALEPEPGVFDQAYVGQIEATVAQLAGEGLYAVIDVHQDLFSERFEGEGAPEWAVQDEGRENPHFGFPANYQSNPALWAAFDNLLEDSPGPGGVGLQERFAAAWRELASHLAGNPHVLGYELFNEPFPGRSFIYCLSTTCPAREAKLTGFYRLITAEIREVDTATPIYYEPFVLFNFGAPTTTGPLGDPNAGFAFHDYCRGTPPPTGCRSERSVFVNAVAHTRETGEALLMTEFGASRNEADLLHVVGLADSYRVPWLYWDFCSCEDPTGAAEAPLVFDAALPPVGANVDAFAVQTLVRPYPQLVAGTPRAWRYDRSTRAFSFSWAVRRADGAGRFPPGSITRIAVPVADYPSGYTVQPKGAGVVSAPGAPILELASTVASGVATVKVLPAA